MLGVMGGKLGSLTSQYLQLCSSALAAVRKHGTFLLGLMEITAYKSSYPSFRYNKNAISDFKKRLLLGFSDSQLREEVEKMFERSNSNSGTSLYDQFQLMTNGIAV